MRATWEINSRLPLIAEDVMAGPRTGVNPVTMPPDAVARAPVVVPETAALPEETFSCLSPTVDWRILGEGGGVPDRCCWLEFSMDPGNGGGGEDGGCDEPPGVCDEGELFTRCGASVRSANAVFAEEGWAGKVVVEDKVELRIRTAAGFPPTEVLPTPTTAGVADAIDVTICFRK